MNVFTYSGTADLRHLDPALDHKEVQFGNTIRAGDEFEAEMIAIERFMQFALPEFPGYRLGKIKVHVRVASDAAWGR